ncbi:MAG: hypothetical protein ABI539_02990 [Acidobacteriota bacterium]
MISGAAGLTATLLSSCATADQPDNTNSNGVSPKPTPDAKEVTAVEDLMREHGILRRGLLVYSGAAMRLRKNAANVSPAALQKIAKLFRTFGEDYHEKKLEEA